MTKTKSSLTKEEMKKLLDDNKSFGRDKKSFDKLVKKATSISETRQNKRITSSSN